MELLTRIQAILQEIEAQQRVRIVYAVESGSRAWGFASEDSDYDVRFIFIREIKDYLRVSPPRDVIELPVTEVLDVNGWDLFKALGLFRKSNPPLLEWLHSPIIYREEGDLALRLRELAQTHYSAKRMTYHYLSMAVNNYKTSIEDRPEVSLKKYLYVMRPLVCIAWIEQNTTPPPTSIWETLEGITLAHDIGAKLSELLHRKQNTSELGSGPADQDLNAFIIAEIQRISDHVAEMPDPFLADDLLNALAWAELGLS